MEINPRSKTTATDSSNNNQPGFLMNPTSSQSLPPSPQCSQKIFIEYQLMKEFVLFQKQKFLHVYISPSYESAFEWFGVMFIHRGLYKGKILRFSIFINPSYPNCDIPQIIFDPIPHHPLVDNQTGQMNLSIRFNNWNSTNNFIFEVIAFAKQAFEFDNLNELNDIVNINDNNDMQLFRYDLEHLKEDIEVKMKDFNDKVIKKKCDDRNYIDFTNEPENSSMIEKVKQKLLTEKFLQDSSLDYLGRNGSNNSASGNHHKVYCSTSISGLSWVKKIVYN